MNRLLSAAAMIVLLMLAATACRVAADDMSVDSPDASPITGTANAARPGDVACDRGLTADGVALLQTGASATQALPTYDLAVDIDPSSGEVTGSMNATIPATSSTMYFRIFAGMDAFNANLEIDHVSVNGSSADFVVDTALLTIEGPADLDDTTVVSATFSYTIDQMAANESIFGAFDGSTLEPDQVGLLGRTDSGMQLGHWFPVWLPDGTRTDPDPSGFGDIGAFPAAAICARIAAPGEYQIVTSGVELGSEDGALLTGGTGLRDFAVVLSNDLAEASGVVDGVSVRVWGPADDPDALATVLDHALLSQQALVDAFGPYPWQEIDLVSTPLGGGVGGMEWPGMIWIERSMFAGGLPGMGDLGGLEDLFGDVDLDSLLGGAGGIGGSGGIGGIAIDTTLEWTVAHELGHEWWHALVGNDSIASPAVDEPLAQFSACIAMQQIHPDNWRAICEAQTIEQYAMTRALGVADAPADQASDEFSNALQYGAVVYGKAPGFYLETADLIGWDSLTAALADFIEQNAFTLVSTDALRTHLVEAAGDDGEAVDALWQRWFQEARGDEDIEPVDLFDAMNFGDLFGEDGPFSDLESGELNLDELFGEDSPFGDLESGDLDLEELLEALLGE